MNILNLIRPLGLIAAFTCISAGAVDFKGLPPSERTRIHALTDAEFWKQYPEMDGQYLDANSPYCSKWMAIRNKIMAQEFPDPADSQNGNDVGSSSGKINTINQPATTSGVGTTSGRVVKDGNLVLGSGTVKAGDTWQGSFQSLWDNSRGHFMKAFITFTADDDTPDQVAMQFSLKDSAGAADGYLLGKGGTANSILYTPGLFTVSVYNQLMPNALGLPHTNNRERSFNFRIEFFDPAPPNDSTANFNANPNQYKFPEGGTPVYTLLQSASAAVASSGHHSSSSSSSSSGAGYVKVPVAPRMNSGGDYVIPGPNGTRVWASSGKPYTGP